MCAARLLTSRGWIRPEYRCRSFRVSMLFACHGARGATIMKTIASIIQTRALESPAMPRETLITVTGTLEELNARDGVTGIVREPDGTEWICTFAASDTPRLRDAWLHTVQVTGTSSDHHIDVRQVAVAEELVGVLAQADRRSRTKKSVEQLAHEQGISVAPTFADLAKHWPADDDPDEFLDWLLAERRQGR